MFAIAVLILCCVILFASGGKKGNCGVTHDNCRDEATHHKGECKKQHDHAGKHQCNRCGQYF